MAGCQGAAAVGVRGICEHNLKGFLHDARRGLLFRLVACQGGKGAVYTLRVSPAVSHLLVVALLRTGTAVCHNPSTTLGCDL